MFLVLTVCVAVVALGDIPATKPLPKDALQGTWEAIDLVNVCGIYRMVIRSDHDADLIHLLGPSPDLRSQFLGHSRLVSFADGSVVIRFILFPEHVAYSDWIEIRGDAYGAPGHAKISGMMVKHHGPLLESEKSEPTVFMQGDWTRELAKASVEAESILRDPHIENGHAFSSSGRSTSFYRARGWLAKDGWLAVLWLFGITAATGLILHSRRIRRGSE